MLPNEAMPIIELLRLEPRPLTHVEFDILIEQLRPRHMSTGLRRAAFFAWLTRVTKDEAINAIWQQGAGQ